MVAYADTHNTESLKPLHTLFDTYEPLAGEIILNLSNRMVQNAQTFELFDDKLSFFNYFWQSVDAIL